MRILVTGIQGQVVKALRERASLGLEIVALGRPQLDLAIARDLSAQFSAISPDVIVNAAAYTAVDRAESESELAFAINAKGAGAVAKAAHQLSVPIIQISTDYVFDGSATKPISETQETNPLGVYGASKLAGEEAVRAATPNHSILRTAWVYAPFGSNFARTMLRLAVTRDEIRVVADQFGTPNSAHDLAAAIENVARNLVGRPDGDLRGVFHLTSTGGPISWADFASEIFRQSSALGGPSARVVPILSSDYPTQAKRPAYSCLDGQKLSVVYDTTLPDWKVGLARVMERLHEGQWG